MTIPNDNPSAHGGPLTASLDEPTEQPLTEDQRQHLDALVAVISPVLSPEAIFHLACGFMDAGMDRLFEEGAL